MEGKWNSISGLKDKMKEEKDEKVFLSLVTIIQLKIILNVNLKAFQLNPFFLLQKVNSPLSSNNGSEEKARKRTSGFSSQTWHIMVWHDIPFRLQIISLFRNFSLVFKIPFLTEASAIVPHVHSKLLLSLLSDYSK